MCAICLSACLPVCFIPGEMSFEPVFSGVNCWIVKLNIGKFNASGRRIGGVGPICFRLSVCFVAATTLVQAWRRRTTLFIQCLLNGEPRLTDDDDDDIKDSLLCAGAVRD